ncbi:hypothetical protein CAPTEDRAFT_154121 [Capitella teleta]|uniref:Inositol hexakisphosphate and diphosphoinositol-pentakisphosphate kinase n=1 Tax=Capitella teleta TaxID=283909 RepID=R7TB70_CAPTE|nr:hypothetical protein CAPTEDRAFT_154121 [Capitella teleta]|eukprot:ELT90954.1 hypothetical protein CAPTEDRAFT_154121 [Capitella teleta]
MRKKANSRAMREILDRLACFTHLKIIIFEESVIIGEPVEKWPMCDCLISFHSSGFPLSKAVRYAELRKPMIVNDLQMQYKIQDSRKAVHDILTEQKIDQPRYAVLDRTHPDFNEGQVVETEDSVEIGQLNFAKPFVEKPVNAEDHNVYIYFPISAGGGSQRLFRKIGSRSSVYSPVSTIRKTGSFIYEEFMPTDGTDVKVYTVGPDYAHAEARKSPALDGKVERDTNGKEIRYPVLLSAKEKLIARKVCMAFKQNVCGFDLLRANGCSYVCDVNGFSFVKTSPKYYDDCAKILGNMILRQLAPQLHIPYSVTYQPEDIPIVPTTSGTMMELRAVIAIVRHGDRTPKQKMKMEVRHKKFFDLFEKYGGFKASHLKLKRPKQLQEVLDIARFLLARAWKQLTPGQPSPEQVEVEEKLSKLEQLKSVLEMYGHFSGINRKIQFKYQPLGAPKKSSSDDDECRGGGKPSLVLILKWGGELTPAGKIQAEELGRAFRCMYPGGHGDYGNSPGLGLMRLQSTYRHDLKIYASDEGRVQMTAAAFAKGLLALEGELTPILVQMVKSANMNGLLDNDNESSKYQNIVKEKLQMIMNQDSSFTKEDIEKLAPVQSSSLLNAIHFVDNPYRTCSKIFEIMQRLVSRILRLKNQPRASDMRLYHNESWELMQRRWTKLVKDFRTKGPVFDISKIPDIYDCIKYDCQHNMKILRFKEAEELHFLSKAMADIVVPQEYGITREEKVMIGQRICTPLLRKVLMDLQRNVDEDSTRLDSRYSEGVSSPHRHVRTRLYFTSESHIHSLLTMLRFGGLCDILHDEQWRKAMDYIERVSELNYMTQIVIMMYENPNKDPQSEERFHIELHFSPGAYNMGLKEENPSGRGYVSQFSEQMKEEEEKKNLVETQNSIPENGDEKESDSDSPAAKHKKILSDEIPPTEPKIVHFEAPPTPIEEKNPESTESADSDSASNGQSMRSSRRRHQSAESISSAPDEDLGRDRRSSSLEKTSDEPEAARRPRSASMEGSMNDLPCTYSNKSLIENRHSFLSLFGRDASRNRLDTWRVPSICPLETLHNALTHRQVETFLKKVTDGVTGRTPFSSPSQGTPSCGTPRSHSNPTMLGLPHLQGSSSAGSSSGPSSPSALSSPDDIMRKLKLLISHSDSDSTTSSSGN